MVCVPESACTPSPLPSWTVQNSGFSMGPNAPDDDSRGYTAAPAAA